MEKQWMTKITDTFNKNGTKGVQKYSSNYKERLSK
jgi:hypothetical protein